MDGIGQLYLCFPDRPLLWLPDHRDIATVHIARSSSGFSSKLPDLIQDQIYNLFSNGVVATSEVVCCILLSRDQLFRLE